MAKAKLIQVTSGCNIETQNNKSLLVNVNSKQQVDGPTDVTTYEIYAKANTNNNKSNSGGESSSSSSSKNTAYYNLSTTIGGHHYHHAHHNIDQGKNSALPGSLGTGLNNLDSGFDVDSSTCTATTTSKINIKMNLDIEYFNCFIMSISSRNIADKFGRKPTTNKQKPTVISFKQTAIRHYATDNHKHIEQY